MLSRIDIENRIDSCSTMPICERSDLSVAIAETCDAPGGFTAPGEPRAAVMQALQASRALLLTDEVTRERPTPERQRLHAALSEAGWALVLPLLSESQGIGATGGGPQA